MKVFNLVGVVLRKGLLGLDRIVFLFFLYREYFVGCMFIFYIICCIMIVNSFKWSEYRVSYLDRNIFNFFYFGKISVI